MQPHKKQTSSSGGTDAITNTGPDTGPNKEAPGEKVQTSLHSIVGAFDPKRHLPANYQTDFKQRYIDKYDKRDDNDDKNDRNERNWSSRRTTETASVNRNVEEDYKSSKLANDSSSSAGSSGTASTSTLTAGEVQKTHKNREGKKDVLNFSTRKGTDTSSTHPSTQPSTQPITSGVGLYLAPSFEEISANFSAEELSMTKLLSGNPTPKDDIEVVSMQNLAPFQHSLSLEQGFDGLIGAGAGAGAGGVLNFPQAGGDRQEKGKNLEREEEEEEEDEINHDIINPSPLGPPPPYSEHPHTTNQPSTKKQENERNQRQEEVSGKEKIREKEQLRHNKAFEKTFQHDFTKPKHPNIKKAFHILGVRKLWFYG